MASKHTKGPWTLHHNGDGSWTILGEKISEKEYRWVIAFLQNGEIYTEEQKKIMKLIAAAPDMLKALERLVSIENSENPNEVFDAFYYAKEVILKATE